MLQVLLTGHCCISSPPALPPPALLYFCYICTIIIHLKILMYVLLNDNGIHQSAAFTTKGPDGVAAVSPCNTSCSLNRVQYHLVLRDFNPTSVLIKVSSNISFFSYFFFPPLFPHPSPTHLCPRSGDRVGCCSL